jgi:hypothetical protein
MRDASNPRFVGPSGARFPRPMALLLQYDRGRAVTFDQKRQEAEP